jgi:hypothetical protein
VGLLTRIMSAADSAEDKKLVAEQRFPVRVRHNLFFAAKENGQIG